jgi:hypothetical protein
MLSSLRLTPVILGALMAAPICAADETTIDFSNLVGTLGDYGNIPTGYGSFSANTPNIAVSYSTNVGTAASPVWVDYMSFWQGDYGDLPAVAYSATNGFYGVISLTPNPGYDVTLDFFLMAGYPTAGGSEPDQYISVDNSLFQPYPGEDYTPYTMLNTGDSLFSPDVTSTGTINIVFGPSWCVGIDDITFSEESIAPDVANSAFLLGAALLAMACFAKRSRLLTFV